MWRELEYKSKTYARSCYLEHHSCHITDPHACTDARKTPVSQRRNLPLPGTNTFVIIVHNPAQPFCVFQDLIR